MRSQPDPAVIGLSGGCQASPEAMRKQIIRLRIDTADESFVIAMPRPEWSLLIGGKHEVTGWIEAVDEGVSDDC